MVVCPYHYDTALNHSVPANVLALAPKPYVLTVYIVHVPVELSYHIWLGRQIGLPAYGLG